VRELRGRGAKLRRASRREQDTPADGDTVTCAR
jgi:hypothetical protein